MEANEKQIKRIVLDRIEQCSVCHRRFASEDIQVLSRKPEIWMMVVECGDCHARNFVAAVVGDGDTGDARAALRDLAISVREQPEMMIPTPSEVDQPGHEPGDVVSVDDVLGMHDFLDEFDGDFQSLFARG